MAPIQSPHDSYCRTADGVLDEDLYCLQCGYNLRGLSGDPVRCPECGLVNDLGVVSVPARLIRQALRDMENAPTVCVFCAGCTVFVLIVTLLVIGNGRTPRSAGLGVEFESILVGGVAVVGWFWSAFWARRVFEHKDGWKRILIDFHVATLLCLPLFSCILFIHGVVEARFGLPLVTVWVAASAAMAYLAMRIYFRARGRLEAMQQETAVRIARNTVRKLLQHEKR